MATEKDLFDDSTMTFGEHLEVLRTHLIRALLGVALCVAVTLIYGEELVKVIRQPVDRALARVEHQKIKDDIKGVSFWQSFRGQVAPTTHELKPEEQRPKTMAERRTVVIELPAHELAEQLHQASPETYPAPADELKDKTLTLHAQSDAFIQYWIGIEKIERPVTLNVQEAFVTYMKVSFVAGLIIASPWVFYQLWLFIAAGLYPHERKYIYTYLPMSLVLFLGGVFFCFYAVLPTVLDFLLGFNVRTELTAQIRISEWISFAIMLPLLFGISFQLPMVMLFLSRINLFTVKQYIAQWKMAVLVIAILSMLLTPTPDPMTMILMMVPLLALYALGIGLCHWTRPKVAVEAAT